jgi:hypothetical protein
MPEIFVRHVFVELVPIENPQQRVSIGRELPGVVFEAGGFAHESVVVGPWSVVNCIPAAVPILIREVHAFRGCRLTRLEGQNNVFRRDAAFDESIDESPIGEVLFDDDLIAFNSNIHRDGLNPTLVAPTESDDQKATSFEIANDDGLCTVFVRPRLLFVNSLQLGEMLVDDSLVI